MAEHAEILEASLLPPDDGDEGAHHDDAPRRRRPGPVVVLAAALAVALAAVAVLAWRLWRDERRDAGQEAAVAVVRRYTEALDRHDLTGLRATLSDHAAFAGGEHLGPQSVGPFTASDLDDFYAGRVRADVRIATTGGTQVTGGGPYRIAAVQTVRYRAAGVPVTEEAISLFTVLERPDGPVVVEPVWWRPLATQNPSMLWAR